MKIRHKVYLSQITLVVVLTLFSLFTFYQYKKHYQQDMDNYVQNIINSKSKEFLKSLDYINNKVSFQKKIYYKINRGALEKLRKNRDLDLVSLKNSLIKEFNIDEDLNIELYLINKELIIYDSTFKRDLGYDLKTIADTQYYIDEINKENKITFVNELSLDNIDNNFKQYSLVKLDDNTYFEMGFTDHAINNLIGKIFVNETSSLLTTKFYRILFDTEYEAINDMNQKILVKNKNLYYKNMNKFYYDEPTNNPIIKARREFQQIKIENDNTIDIYYPMMNDDITRFLHNGFIVAHISIDITKQKNMLREFELTIFIMFVLLLLFLTGMFIWIKKNFTEATNTIANNISNSTAIDNDILLRKNDEFGTIANRYNKLLESLNDEINKNKSLLLDNKRFIADTVHQIRTPLSVIMMNSDLIKMYQEDSDTEEFLNQINASINMLTNSYEDLAYITSHDSIKYTPVNINISNILKERIDFFSTIAYVNNKSFSQDIQSDIYFHINQIELERVIDNNISNAIKYAEADKPITIKLIKIDNTIELSFLSYAKAIKNPDRVFDKDYRENEEKRGLGLGLNMVKGICEKYKISYNLSYQDKQNIFTYTFKKI